MYNQYMYIVRYGDIVNYQYICTMNSTFELEGHCHILFSMIDYVSAHVKGA